MKALFVPAKLGLEMLGTLPGNLRVAHDRDRGSHLFTGDNLEAIRAAHGIVPSAAGVAVAARIAASAVPETITPSQLRLQLIADSKSAATVLAIIAQLPEPVQSQAAVLWEYALEFHRAHPLVIQFAGALGYDTPAKLDAFFIAAAKR